MTLIAIIAALGLLWLAHVCVLIATDGNWIARPLIPLTCGLVLDLVAMALLYQI